MTKNVDAIRRLFSARNSRVGNLPSLLLIGAELDPVNYRPQ
jgi:hypothetical protein